MGKVIEVGYQERRRDRRREVAIDATLKPSIAARLDGYSIRVLDVSFGGIGGELAGDDAAARLPPLGAKATLILMPPSGEKIAFRVEVVRRDKDGRGFGARFTTLSDREYRVVERLTMGRPL